MLKLSEFEIVVVLGSRCEKCPVEVENVQQIKYFYFVVGTETHFCRRRDVCGLESIIYVAMRARIAVLGSLECQCGHGCMGYCR